MTRYPDFLVVGSPKCGTTALADALRYHPDLFVPEAKELNLFDSPDWETASTRFAHYFEPARPHQLCGEATPTYAASSIACERIARANPRCKIIMMVREPVERAHSHYWFRWNTGREVRSFVEAIEHEISVPDEAGAYLIPHGMYSRNLRRYREHLGKERVLVILFEELSRRPETVFEQCTRFLEVGPHPLVLERSNAARAPRSMMLMRAFQQVRRYDGPPKTWLRSALPEQLRKGVVRRAQLFLTRPTKNPPLPGAASAKLRDVFFEDVRALRADLGHERIGWPLFAV